MNDSEFIALNKGRNKRAKLVSDMAGSKKKGPEFRDGALKKIVLKNFMVHQELEIEFGGNVNIITGANGSGKSAILQALVIALGNSV